MALQGGYTDPNRSNAEWVLLPPDKHACVLLKPTLDKKAPHPQSDAAKKGILEISEVRWTFEGLQFRGPLDEKGVPKKGVVSLWTGFNYGDPKAKLTHLLNAIFGRPLTEEEARRLDFEKFEGIKGWVMVSPKTKTDGSPGTVFAGFMWPNGTTPPKPSDFFVSGGTTPPLAQSASMVQDSNFPPAPGNPFGGTVGPDPFETEGGASEDDNPFEDGGK